MKQKVAFLSVIVVALILSSWPILLAQESQKPLALINGTLIDGTGSDSMSDSVVIIKKDRIAAVGSSRSLKVPSNAKVVDVKGMTILPGFINAHVHNAYRDFNLRTWAQDGVTTVRDLGTQFGKRAFQIRDELLKDSRNARLVAAGPQVTALGGYHPLVRLEVSGPEDASKKVNELADAGADLIKIMIEDHLMRRQWPMLSMDEINSIVKTAYERGLPVSAHITRARHLEKAIKGGVDDVAHMIIIDDLSKDHIDRMNTKKIYWVPTLELWKIVSQMYNLDWKAKSVENLRRFIQAGGKVALGTDFGGASGSFDSGMPITEMELMKEAGMRPMQIIVAGTKYAAHVCNLENELGTIETGKIADIIIVSFVFILILPNGPAI